MLCGFVSSSYNIFMFETDFYLQIRSKKGKYNLKLADGSVRVYTKLK